MHVDKPSKRRSSDEVMEELFGLSADDVEVFDDPEIEEQEDELSLDMEILGEDLPNTTSTGTAETEPAKEKKKASIRKFREEWTRKFSFLKYIVRGKEEFMKCLWCERYKLKGPWGKGSGCKTIMVSAIRKHRRSKEHAWAAARFHCENGVQMPAHMEVMTSRNISRVITVMKLAYFNAREDLALRKYEKLCELAYALDVQNMPKQHDYSSYTNRVAGKNFVFSISEYLKKSQLEELLHSPFYGVTLDETTDRGLEKHLIVYFCFLPLNGKGLCKIEFGTLVIVSDGTAQTKYDALLKVLDEFGLEKSRMVGIATDGDSSMTGCHEGLIAKLKRVIPHLSSIHCIAHREALAVVDTAKHFACLSYIDKIANKVYSWICASSQRHTEFQALLKEMNLQVLEVLQIHDVRWLARGNVMARLTQVLPAILSVWQDGATLWYKKLRVYKVLFCIHMLADVLHDMNMLSKQFQADIIDLSSISTCIDVTVSSLRRKFLEQDFGKGTIYLKKFMSDTESKVLQHVNDLGTVYAHELLYERIPGKTQKGIRLDPFPGDVESCIVLAKSFVQKLIDCINERFPDVLLFNAVKVFSPQHYPRNVKKDTSQREEKVNKWLDQLLDRFGGFLVDKQGCKDEILSFTDTLYYGCEGMNMMDAWRVFSCNFEWQNTYPNMMKLWQILLVVPASSVACERGFSKQNIIKTDDRQCLDVKTLEALMRISLLGPDVNDVDWTCVHDIWNDLKARRVCDGL
ncbi:hypothetical protein L7F22_020712 [Adiantum nelumboides]|nr:hypothetical protein [Adiantum nelumboides]